MEWFIDFFLRASLTIIAKIVIEKVQLSALAIVFSIFFPTNSLFYSLLAFKYYFPFFFYYIFAYTQWKKKYWISTHSLGFIIWTKSIQIRLNIQHTIFSFLFSFISFMDDYFVGRLNIQESFKTGIQITKITQNNHCNV